MNTADKKQTKTVLVDLFAHETVLVRRQIVVEMPADLEKERMRELSGTVLDSIAACTEHEVEWEAQETVGIATLNEIKFSRREPPPWTPHVVVGLSDDGGLVAAAPDV